MSVSDVSGEASPTDTGWDHLFRTSSFCASGGCVEVAPLPDGNVAIRDSKDLSRPVHVYTPAEWSAFIAGVKNGEFDFC